MPQPALFLDRDGVIIVDKGYVYLPHEVEWIAGAREAVREANERGYLVIVVSNQSGVARGFFSEEQVTALHTWMQAEMHASGARIDAFYYCPHHPTVGTEPYRADCGCRKPLPGLFEQAIREWDVDVSRSISVGDNFRDIEASRAAGVKGHLFSGGDLRSFVVPLLGW